MYKGEVTEELTEIYNSAHEDGIWLREWPPIKPNGKYMAAAGNIESIGKLEKKLGEEIDFMELGPGDLSSISILGAGSTREEACSQAIRELKRYETYTGKKR